MSDVKKTPKIGEGLAGPGRPKGMLNKSTALLKDAILEAAANTGDIEGEPGLVNYLQWASREQPGPFIALLGKVLPLTLAGDPNNPLMIVSKEQKDAAVKAATRAGG